MGALTPSFLFDLESNMRHIQESEYVRLSENMYWSRFCKVLQSGVKKELVNWLLTTAKIEDLGRSGGKMVFEDLVAIYTTFESKNAGAGLRLKRQQFEDLDGNGVDLATKWAADVGAYMAYWPQKQFANALKNGQVAGNTTYDGKTFFAPDHPVNGVNPDNGTFANLFTGAAAGTYPGALPIDDSVTLDVAIVNLSKAIAYVKSIRMPNGEDPRYLRATTLIVPPRMQQRAVQLTNAKFIAQAASGGGAGSTDVEAFIASMGLVQPVVADELSGFENDTTWFLACEELSKASQLGAFVYVDREPFRITYYTGLGGGTGVDAILSRADELEWHCKGRNVLGYGHPYLMHKCKAA